MSSHPQRGSGLVAGALQAGALGIGPRRRLLGGGLVHLRIPQCVRQPSILVRQPLHLLPQPCRALHATAGVLRVKAARG